MSEGLKSTKVRDTLFNTVNVLAGRLAVTPPPVKYLIVKLPVGAIP